MTDPLPEPKLLRRSEAWCGDERCGTFWEDEVRWLLEAGEPITIYSADD